MHLDVVVQAARSDTLGVALHRDPVAPFAWAVGERVGARDAASLSGALELDREMLAGLEVRQGASVPRLEDEGGDLVGLWDLLDQAQRSDGAPGLLPAQRQRLLELDNLIELEVNQAPRAREAFERWRVPVDPNPSGELKQSAALEIDEQDARSGVHHEIADGVVVAVPRIVGKDQLALTLDPHEARLASPMRGVHAEGRALALSPMPGPDEERVGALDPAAQRRGEPVVGAPHRGGPGGLAPPRAFVDVLRAVPERLVDGDLEAPGAGHGDLPVDAVAAPGGETDPEEAYVDAAAERILEGIARRGSGVDGQGRRIRRADEAGLPHQQRGPRATAPVARRRNDEGEPSVEPAVLVGQMPAHHLARPGLDLVANAEPLLHLLLAGVERGRFRGHGIPPAVRPPEQ